MDIFTKRPLFTSCMLFMMFAVIGIFVPVSCKIIIGIIAMAVFLTAVLLLIIKKIGAYQAVCALLSAVMIGLAMLSSYLFFDMNKNRYEGYYGEYHTIDALVISESFRKGNYTGYEIYVNRIGDDKFSHKAVLTCKYDSVLEPGMVISAYVLAEDIKSYDGGYDPSISMISDGIFVQYTSEEESLVAITSEDGFSLSLVFSNVNKHLKNKFFRFPDKDASGLTSALFLGNKDDLNETATRDFSRAGASHVLALSGMHMSIIMGALMLLLKRLRTPTKIIAVLLSICALAYLFITGMSLSAARSVIMLLMVYLSMLSRSTNDSITSLGVAGALLLLLFPGAVVDAGFWMSFSATLGLLVYMPFYNSFVEKLIKPYGKIKKRIVKTLFSILGAFVTSVFAIVPLVIVLFIFIKEISIATILTSAVLAIPAAGVILLSLLMMPFYVVPAVSGIIAIVIGALSRFMIDFCGYVSEMEHVVFSLDYPFATAAAILIGLSLLYSLISRSGKILKSLVPFFVCCALFFVSITVYDAFESERVKVTYINASSKADMIVLSEGKEAVICDIGNGSNSSYREAMIAVNEARATEVKAIMLTRYMQAHHGSLYYMFTSEKVRELWLPYPYNADDYYKMMSLNELAETHGVDVYIYEEESGVSLFKYTDINVYRYSIARSDVPIIAISVDTRGERLMYLSSSLSDVVEEDRSFAEGLLERSEVVIVGNSGPKKKSDYSMPEDNRIDLMIFSDEISVAYYQKKDERNTTYVLVEDRCNIYLDE